MAALNPLNSSSLLASVGALGVILVLFAETGLRIGFFLPATRCCSLPGCCAPPPPPPRSKGRYRVVVVPAAGGALLGAQTGIVLGRIGGRRPLERSRSKYLRKCLERAEELLAR